MGDTVQLQRFPSWRQAVQDFLSEFKYGDIVTHEWLEEHFGIPTLRDSQRLTAEEFRDRQFAWLASIEAFKSELLRDHQVCLESVRGEGYRWTFPSEQTGVAIKEFERDARRVFRTAGRRLHHIRLDELSENQRRENLDAVTRLSGIRGMIKQLK